MTRGELRVALVRAIVTLRASSGLWALTRSEQRVAPVRATLYLRSSPWRWVLTAEGRAVLRAAYERGLRREPLPLQQGLCLPIVVAHGEGRSAAERDRYRGRGTLRVFRDRFCNHNIPAAAPGGDA